MTRQGTIFNISGLNLLQSQANLGRLWEFHGSSLEVVWEKSGISLEVVWVREFSGNSNDLLGDLVSNLLSFITPLLNGQNDKSRDQRSGILHIVRDP